MRQRDGVISEAFIPCTAVDALDGRGCRGSRGYYYNRGGLADIGRVRPTSAEDP